MAIQSHQRSLDTENGELTAVLAVAPLAGATAGAAPAAEEPAPDEIAATPGGAVAETTTAEPAVPAEEATPAVGATPVVEIGCADKEAERVDDEASAGGEMMGLA